jgi:hypothetical protein
MINWAQLHQQAKPWADAYVANLQRKTAMWEKMSRDLDEIRAKEGLPPCREINLREQDQGSNNASTMPSNKE